MSFSKKLFLFDIDGTLTDTITNYHKAFVDTLTALELTPIDMHFNDYLHHTDSYVLKVNYEHTHNTPMPDDFLDIFEKEITKRYLNFAPCTEIAGAKALLEYLQKQNHAICFATGAVPSAAIAKLKQCKLWHDTKVLATSKTSYTREGFVQEAIDKAKAYYNTTDFSQIISIGDGLWDLKTAQNLNLDFVGIGTKNKEILKQNGCNTWYATLEQYLGDLQTMPK